MSTNWTDDQLKAIESTDCGVVVSAAAGSGKTAVLVERTIRLLADENKKIPADSLLAVTFTNDAAMQMREKLTTAFAERIEQDPDNEWLQIQQARISCAKIQTINAFCLNLVKMNITEFDFQNGLKVLESAETKVIESTALENAVEAYCIKSPEKYRSLYQSFSLNSEEKLFDVVNRLYTFRRSLAFPDSWTKNALKKFSDKRYISKLWESENSKLTTLFYKLGTDAAELSCCAEKLNYSEEIADNLEEFARSAGMLGIEITKKTTAEQYSKLYKELVKFVASEMPSFKSAITKAEAKKLEYGTEELVLLDEAKKLVAKCQKTANVLVSKMNISYETALEDSKRSAEVFKMLVELNELYEAEIMKIKLEKNAVDFADVELMSVKLLARETENGYERTEFCQKLVDSGEYRVILIDEFQDVNNLQNVIFNCLSAGSNPMITGTNEFIVGDVKQAIYRFRQSNPKIFVKARKSTRNYRLEERPKEIILKKNFRSRKSVIDFVNGIFSLIMSENFGGIDYNEDEMLDFGAEYYDGNDLPTEMILLEKPKSDKSNDEDDFSADEYAVTAKRIRKLLEEGTPVFDNGKTRPCQPSDFCVLTPKNSLNAKVFSALKEEGISATDVSSGGYLSMREVSLMINMLKVIDNPMNDLALCSVLVSPIFMMSDDDLAQLRAVNKSAKMSLYLIMLKLAEPSQNESNSAICELLGTGLAKACERIVREIKHLRVCASSMTLERLIAKIYDRTDFFSVVSSFENASQKRANLRLLQNYAQSYENNGIGGLTGFLRYVDRLSEINGDFESAKSDLGTASQVAIKTMHSSKGLEFPFVFIVGISNKIRRNDLVNIVMNEEMGVGFKLCDVENKCEYKTLNFNAIKQISDDEEISEKVRLLYVSMTRAKERLFLVMTLPSQKGEPYKRIKSAFGDEGKPNIDVLRSMNNYSSWILSALLFSRKDPRVNHYFGKSLDKAEKSMTDNFVFDGVEDDEPFEYEQLELIYEPSEEAVRQLEKQMSFVYDRTLSEMNAKLTVTEIAKGSDADVALKYYPKVPKFSEEIGALTATEKGTATHTFMELADLKSAFEDIEREISRLVVNGFLTQKQADVIDRETLSSFFKSELFQRMMSSRKLMKEQSFLVRIGDLGIKSELVERYKNSDGMLQGIADCIFEEENGYVLVDYKTDRVSSAEELAERYTLQLQLYKSAFELLLEKPVCEAYIYSFKLKQGIKINI